MTEESAAATTREDGPELTPIKAILADMDAYNREYKKWEDRAKGIIDRYRDVRVEGANQTLVIRKYNILWSNVETLKPTLYARLPQVAVERRFKDADPVGKLACEIAERLGNYVIQTSPFDQVMKACVSDRLLPGRATSWIGYESEGNDVDTDQQVKDEAGNDVKNDDGTPKMETEYQKTQEAVVPKYVDWKDIFHSPVRTWDEVKVVGRYVYMGRAELIKRFGEEKAATIPLDRKPKDEKDNTDYVTPQAKIAEVYYKPTRKVYWVHPTIKDEALDEADPPVNFENFWPCPKPLFATMTNDTLIPIPDFIFYQDQANELDIVTNRIARLTDALKAVGVYDASQDNLARILSTGTPDNTLVPVTSWAGFMEKGGLAGAIQLVPIEQIAATLTQLYAARAQIIQIIYDVTGLADIIRGSSDPNETATAQSIKGQFASLRIKDTQAEVSRFARDNARLIIECGIRMFEPETISEMVMAESFCPISPQEQQQRAAMQQAHMQTRVNEPFKPTPPQSFMAALRLLKDDRLRSFHIDIETDSTIALNEKEDKEQASEFITAVGGFLQQSLPLAQSVPAAAPMVGEMLMFLVRRFRAGRSLEGSIEKTMQALQQPQPPKPDPAMEKVKAQAQVDQAELARKAKDDQGHLQLDATKAATDAKLGAAAVVAKVAPAAGAQMAVDAVKPPPAPPMQRPPVMAPQMQHPIPPQMPQGGMPQ